MQYEKKIRKKALIHRSSTFLKARTCYFCNSCLLFVISALCDLPREDKFLKTIFGKQFSQSLVYEVFCKGNEFPESWGDLFVNFDTFQLMIFLDDCGKGLFSFLFLGHSQVFFPFLFESLSQSDLLGVFEF